MTNEAREKAIRWLTEEVRSLRLAPKVNGCKPDNWAEQLEVMETCLELVRGCNQVANKSQFGCDPLKMEQLREMDGQKVLLYRMKSTEPLEPGTVKQNGDVIGDAGMLAYHELYLETWVAFTYPPAHIDMAAWKPCNYCANTMRNREVYKTEKYAGVCDFEVFLDCGEEIAVNAYNHQTPYTDEICFSFPVSYCPKCGRPLTEEARAELEKRLRGGA